jgi:hypothetical protein
MQQHLGWCLVQLQAMAQQRLQGLHLVRQRPPLQAALPLDLSPSTAAEVDAGLTLLGVGLRVWA